MRSSLRKMGNSSAVIIPKPLLVEIGAIVGDDVELLVEDGRIVVAPIKQHSRSGWAEDAARIADVGDDALVWPEFGNEGDVDLAW